MQERKIKCPQCGKLTEYKSTNSFRPFCSERCQLIDLGEWANEKFAVPGEKVNPDNLDANPQDRKEKEEED